MEGSARFDCDQAYISLDPLWNHSCTKDIKVGAIFKYTVNILHNVSESKQETVSKQYPSAFTSQKDINGTEKAYKFIRNT